MRWLWVLVVAAGCRTPPWPEVDATASDLAEATSDLAEATSDLGEVASDAASDDLRDAGDLGDATSDDLRDAMSDEGASDGGTRVFEEVLAVGDFHSCGLGSGGTLFCWGWSGANGTGDERPVPSDVGFTDWTAVVGGRRFGCGLRDSGEMWCWGTTTSVFAPSSLGGPGGVFPGRVGAPTDRWRSMAAGRDHTCGVKTDGSLWCWGYNSTFEELGLDLQKTTTVVDPTQVGSDRDWDRISSSGNHTCGVKTDGSLWCWGANYGFVSGLVSHVPPMQIGSWRDWRLVRPGRVHTCALRSSGQLYCWGYGGTYLWTGQATAPKVPTPVAGAADWRTVASASNATCGIRNDGTLWCVGEPVGESSCVGCRAPLERWQVPTQMGSDDDWDAIALGLRHVCARKRDGRVFCWGGGEMGQLGLGRAPRVTTPQPVGAFDDWQELSVGDASGCSTRAGGALWCWGDVASQTFQAPVQIGSDGGWNGVSAGTSHACGLQNGALYCWGENLNGELGDGSLFWSREPARVGVETDWEKVVAGSYRTCGLRHGGRLYCWGLGDSGTGVSGLGIGTLDDARRPTEVGAADDRWLDVSTGHHAGCAVRSDHTLWCWGGLGPTGTLVPVQLGDGTDWQSIRLGGSTACGLRTARSVWCWGSNSVSQLGGLGRFVDDPTRMPDESADALSVGLYHRCSLSLPGEIRCAGDNSMGQLGDGTTAGHASTLLSLDDAVEIGVGGRLSCARRAGGTIWCWGSNWEGALGNGGLYSASPEQVVGSPL